MFIYKTFTLDNSLFSSKSSLSQLIMEKLSTKISHEISLVRIPISAIKASV